MLLVVYYPGHAQEGAGTQPRLNTAPKPKRLPLRDFADLAGVSTDTVRRWIKAGYIKSDRNPPSPRRKPGQPEGWGRLFIMETELARFAKPRRVVEPAQTPPLPIRARKGKLQKVRDYLETVDFSDLVGPSGATGNH